MPQNIGENRIVEDGIARITHEDAERLGRYLVRSGDIVYSRRGDVERRALVREREDGWLCGTGCLRVRLGDRGPDSRYVSYYLAHPSVRQWIVRHAQGATMPNLNTSILAACPLVVPPRSEQCAIADVLGSLDDKIELHRRMNETLEGIARAIFKSWFVDFDPVRAKAEGRDPGLPKPLADLFPGGLVESSSGETPKGWSVATLENFAELNPETWTKATRPRVIKYVDLTNAKWGRIEQVVGFDANDAPSRAQRVLRQGDTIVGTVRPGNGSYARISYDGLTGSTGFAVLRPRQVMLSVFVYMAATAESNIDRLAHLADGAAYPAVNAHAVAATEVVRPSPEVMAAYAQMVDPMMARLALNEAETAALASIRDTVLPKLISGEIRLDGVEAEDG